MKKYAISALFLLLSLSLFSISEFMGTQTAINGRSVEVAFFCTPLAHASLGLALFFAVYCFYQE